MMDPVGGFNVSSTDISYAGLLVVQFYLLSNSYNSTFELNYCVTLNADYLGSAAANSKKLVSVRWIIR